MDSTSHSRRRAPVLWGLIALLAALSLTFGMVAQASAATFNPENIISNANMRDYDSMSAAEIQAFLEAQPGVLDTRVTTDYAGVRKRASTIIWQACRKWTINPKVMLTMLQKEQSLLTRTTLDKNTLSRAIGAGCPGGPSNRFPGFGKQMWNGARLLDGYGEGKNGSTIPLYYRGIAVKDIYRKPKVTLHPANVATYKLFVYNPSIGAKKPYGDLSAQKNMCTGNANFWLIYRKYFGGTFANPRMRRVFRFRNRHTGTYLYTTSINERYHLSARHSKTWVYGGSPFSVDTSVTAASTVPVYRFYNVKTHKYSFTRSAKKYRSRRSKTGRKTWKYGGVAFRVSAKAKAKSVTVYRMHNKQTGAYLLTASKKSVTKLRKTAKSRRTWAYDGVAFYLPRLVTS